MKEDRVRMTYKYKKGKQVRISSEKDEEEDGNSSQDISDPNLDARWEYLFESMDTIIALNTSTLEAMRLFNAWIKAETEVLCKKHDAMKALDACERHRWMSRSIDGNG